MFAKLCETCEQYIYYTCIISKIVKLILRARRLVTVTATVTLRLAVCKWR